MAVLVPIEQWRRLERTSRRDLKELLLAPEARTDALTPPRPILRRRPAPQPFGVQTLDPFSARAGNA